MVRQGRSAEFSRSPNHPALGHELGPNGATSKDQIMVETVKRTSTVFQWLSLFIFVAVNPFTPLYGEEQSFIYFDTNDIGELDDKVPLIQPFKIVPLDPRKVERSQ